MACFAGSAACLEPVVAPGGLVVVVVLVVVALVSGSRVVHDETMTVPCNQFSRTFPNVATSSGSISRKNGRSGAMVWKSPSSSSSASSSS